jgi:hypothetical protein
MTLTENEERFSSISKIKIVNLSARPSKSQQQQRVKPVK